MQVAVYYLKNTVEEQSLSMRFCDVQNYQGRVHDTLIIRDVAKTAIQ